MRWVTLLSPIFLAACTSQPAASDLPPAAYKTREDIVARVAQDFPGNEEVVLGMLDEYESDGNRVHWVILEHSNGNINRVRELVNLANIDFRDVLMLEYRE